MSDELRRAARNSLDEMLSILRVDDEMRSLFTDHMDAVYRMGVQDGRAAEERAEKAERERDEARRIQRQQDEVVRALHREACEYKAERDEALNENGLLHEANKEAGETIEALREARGGWVSVEERSPPVHEKSTFRATFKATPCYGMHTPFAVHENDSAMRGYGTQVHVEFSGNLEWLSAPPESGDD